MTTAETTLDLNGTAVPVAKPALRIAGLSQTFDEAGVAQIPDLWARLVPALPLPGQDGGLTYGVARTDPDHRLHYLAGVGLNPGAPAPTGYEVREVAARNYLVFRLTIDGGPLHPQIKAAAQEIWQERLPASGHKPAAAPGLEVYPDDFEPNRPGARVEFWIPVEG